MSEVNFSSLEECLNKYIPAEELKEVKRVIFGKSDEYAEIFFIFKLF